MIKTGKSPMTLMTYLAIMSISLIVNLPGLAVTPMLGTLTTIFPHTTQLEKQLLTALPNLLIIPFVLMSGKLSLT
ncbi:MAG: MFS transporter, partial [Muribaculaceae bacterium]|nr:MFS transporter [Muribaculaceae bacterium]